MLDSPDIRRPTIPIAYLQLMVELLGERGIAASELLHRQPIDAALLQQPQARMSAHQWGSVVLRAQQLSRDPGLGYEYGLRMRPTVHGVLGYAALSCSSLQQALMLMPRYVRVRQANFTLRYSEHGRYGMLELQEKQPIPLLRSFFIENILLGLARSTSVLLGREMHELKGLEIWFDGPQPEHYADWRARLPTVRFNRPCNAMRVPAAMLSLRPLLADPLASRQAIELCEQELAQAAGHEVDLVARVRAELVPASSGGYPNLDTVAQRLHLSSRSLKRKLQQQGMSYLTLLEETQRRDAQLMLEHGNVSVQAIAARLGYRNPANFSRAFMRWTGQPPSRWRQQVAERQQVS